MPNFSGYDNGSGVESVVVYDKISSITLRKILEAASCFGVMTPGTNVVTSLDAVPMDDGMILFASSQSASTLAPVCTPAAQPAPAVHTYAGFLFAHVVHADGCAN
jgi:hypothetical protein